MTVRGIAALGSGAGREVAPERTPVGTGQIQAAIGRAYTRVTGTPPSPALLQSLSAQASLETAGGRSMYNFNFGGVKGAGPHGESATCLTHEVIDGKDLTVHQRFRAYASLDEGAEDYVRVVVQKFGGAIPYAAAGNLDAFAHALKQAGYYTASETDYAAALRSASASLPAAPASPLLPVPTAASLPSSLDVTRLFDALSASALRIGEPSSAD